MKNKYLNIYTDGAYYEDQNKIVSVFTIYKNNVRLYLFKDINDASGGADVEMAEALAIYTASRYCQENPENYQLFTDSRSLLDKIQNKVPNATKNKCITSIQNILKDINSSNKPQSLSLHYMKRRSNQFMKEVDDYCKLNITKEN